MRRPHALVMQVPKVTYLFVVDREIKYATIQ
jgi:hypothetical protein